MRDAETMAEGRAKIHSRERNLLAASPLLQSVSPQAAAHLIDTALFTTLPARSTLYDEGERARDFYCVLYGYVRLFRTGRDGRQADLRICGPGEVFAECLIHGGERYRTSAEVAETATIASFGITDVRRLADRDATVSSAISALLSSHLLTIMDCMANDRLYTAPQRVADYLLACCPSDDGAASIRLPYQKSLIAGLLGLAPEALSRAFASLKANGVTVRGRIVQIGDVEALRKI
ncbi:Crp/Fnr family transcriptional regulator [Rhizobium sp. SAFR-030]|uniref:Crp/Fnr family transcriptional regulator n=1 Tax=Rhizobium sp. SAFR-030 TaxID=3387277 RepID=UPI003F812D8F